jgi:hypothetical protein
MFTSFSLKLALRWFSAGGKGKGGSLRGEKENGVRGKFDTATPAEW